MQKIQVLEQSKKKARVCKRCRHLSQARDQGLAKDVGI